MKRGRNNAVLLDNFVVRTAKNQKDPHSFSNGWGLFYDSVCYILNRKTTDTRLSCVRRIIIYYDCVLNSLVVIITMLLLR